MREVIRAENLVKRFGDVVAVKGVTFSVAEGEAFGFLGPNGAGKTTTMRMVQCVSPRSGGHLEVLRMDPATHAREIKALLGVVPQEDNLDPELTGYENLRTYARYFGIAKDVAEERIARLLAFVEMEKKQDVIIEHLSGGMKRRLVLARALVNDPRILVLDEPTTGLDPQARHLIWEQLQGLQAEGRTIVLTTHYMEEAERLCDRLVIMDHGGVLVEGSPTDLIDRTIGRQILEAEAVPAVLSCLDRHGARYDLVGGSVLVPTDDPTQMTAALLQECGSIKLATRPTTLEDVFLKLTGRRLRE
ncbi:lipooligosaccharide transport system ATP-binding protein [Methanofollis sp. W23]|uniref:ABC transporter ATP-binding protein n=1 Tax=Methanofollis sp. W23 TaxID=2817849 RepID=UPI001AE70FF8|nr:ABC transporter ATP-binding protein [Methanofollis sp. W23]MBP2146757.1 lipooligosaccharide transport system ATP-binding protein [Methanofollis sp. W23]